MAAGDVRQQVEALVADLSARLQDPSIHRRQSSEDRLVALDWLPAIVATLELSSVEGVLADSSESFAIGVHTKTGEAAVLLLGPVSTAGLSSWTLAGVKVPLVLAEPELGPQYALLSKVDGIAMRDAFEADLLGASAIKTAVAGVVQQLGLGHRAMGVSVPRRPYVEALRDTFAEFRRTGPSLITPQRAAVAAEIHQRSWPLVPVHGDVTPGNVMLDDEARSGRLLTGEVSGLLDIRAEFDTLFRDLATVVLTLDNPKMRVSATRILGRVGLVVDNYTPPPGVTVTASELALWVSHMKVAEVSEAFLLGGDGTAGLERCDAELAVFDQVAVQGRKLKNVAIGTEAAPSVASGRTSQR